MIRIDCRGLPTDSLSGSQPIRDAIDCFVKHGYAILDNVMPEEKIRALNLEFLQSYAHLLHNKETDDSKAVGPSRYMMPLRFTGGFGDPQIFANPYVLAVVREVLEEAAILEAYGAIVSLAGATAQPPHTDGPHLFGARIAAMLPAHALTMALPLVEMNEHRGTTSFWPGSHRWLVRNEQAEQIQPTIPVGSCMLWDFRLFHRGTENVSTGTRPMAYCTYSKSWYRDPVNFYNKRTMKRLMFDKGFLETLPEDARTLLSHVA
jgi:Phytanoyl-CoA dioxygenase (PhyH)